MLKQLLESDQFKLEFESLLAEFIKIKSISNDTKYKNDCDAAADFIVNFLKDIEFNVKKVQTPGLPIVYADKIFSNDAKTVLIYAHYDVMPADENGWLTDPFELVKKDGHFYGRGVSDDKGQLLMQLVALKILHMKGFKDLNFKILFEGEEEAGSDNLEPFIKDNLTLLKSDFVMVSDTTLASEDVPGIVSSVRGAILFDVTLCNSSLDLHSGVFGGMVNNPANLMSNLITAIKDKDQRVKLEGFYDDVLEYGDDYRKDLKVLDEISFDQHTMNNYGVEKDSRESGYTPFECATIRPSFDINGFNSGFQGEGSKTIIPAFANAKFSFRLIANQDPLLIEKSFVTFCRNYLPYTVKIKIDCLGYYYPYSVDQSCSYVDVALKVLGDVFGNKAYLMPCGGSIPIAYLFKKYLQIETVFMGFGLETDNIHGPNEKILEKNVYRGIEALVEYYKKIVEN